MEDSSVMLTAIDTVPRQTSLNKHQRLNRKSQTSIVDQQVIRPDLRSYSKSKTIIDIAKDKQPSLDIEQEQQQIENDSKYQQKLQRECQIYDFEVNSDEWEYQFEMIRPNKYDILPFLYFYKLLALRNNIEVKDDLNRRVKLNLPDTFIFGDIGEGMSWMYTGENGYVYRKDGFTYKEVENYLGWKQSKLQLDNSEIENRDGQELVGVMKTILVKEGKLAGNIVKLLNKDEFMVQMEKLIKKQPDGNVIVLQRYIRSVGGKASIVRTKYNTNQPNFCYNISNKLSYDHQFRDKKDRKNQVLQNEKYYLNVRKPGKVNINKSYSGGHLKVTVKYIQSISRFINRELNVKIGNMVCDFVRDERNEWWLINVKAFQIVEQSRQRQKETDIRKILKGDHSFRRALSMGHKNEAEYQQRRLRYIKTRQCGYCQILFEENELIHKMSMKMIMQTDWHLQMRGYQFEWLNRFDGCGLSMVQLMKQFHVCYSCYTLYQEIQQLEDLEIQFNQKLGVKVSKDNNTNQISISKNTKNNSRILSMPLYNNVNKFSYNLKKYQTPQNFKLELEEGEEMIVHNDLPFDKEGNSQTSLIKFRFLFCIHMIKNIPKNIADEDQFCFRYQFMGQSSKVDLQFSKREDDRVFMEFTRLYYFFAQDRKSLIESFKQQKHLKLYLYKNNKLIGNVGFSLSEFLGERVIKISYVRFVQLIDQKKELQFGTHVSMGVVQNGYLNIERIKLTEHNGLYLPPHNYCASDPMPHEWLDIFEQLPTKYPSLEEQQQQLDSMFQQTEIQRDDSKFNINSILYSSNQQQLMAKGGINKNMNMNMNTNHTNIHTYNSNNQINSNDNINGNDDQELDKQQIKEELNSYDNQKEELKLPYIPKDYKRSQSYKPNQNKKYINKSLDRINSNSISTNLDQRSIPLDIKYSLKNQNNSLINNNKNVNYSINNNINSSNNNINPIDNNVNYSINNNPNYSANNNVSDFKSYLIEKRQSDQQYQNMSQQQQGSNVDSQQRKYIDQIRHIHNLNRNQRKIRMSTQSYNLI